jgi:hypothetical protein
MGSERGHGDIGVSGSCLNLFKDRVGKKGDTASLLQQRTANSDFDKVLVLQQSYFDIFHSRPTTSQRIFSCSTSNRHRSFP